jgi:hypothetical protein
VEVFDFSHCRVGPAGASALCRGGPQYPNVRTLIMTACELDDWAAAEVLLSPWFRRARHIDMGQNGLTKLAVEALVAPKDRTGLTDLGLGSNHLADAAARAIMAADHLRSVERLDLSRNRVRRWGRTGWSSGAAAGACGTWTCRTTASGRRPGGRSPGRTACGSCSSHPGLTGVVNGRHPVRVR